jgi:hypothetical protein
MKKDGIQTRKRKPKSSSTPKEPKQKHSAYAGERSSKQQQQHQNSDLYQIGGRLEAQSNIFYKTKPITILLFCIP